MHMHEQCIPGLHFYRWPGYKAIRAHYSVAERSATEVLVTKTVVSFANKMVFSIDKC